jgi:hypothetical protein
MNATELKAYRIKDLETPILNIVLGVVHIVWLIAILGTLVLWWRNAQFKKKISGNYKGVTHGARLIICMTIVCGISELGYQSFLFSGWSRAGGVVGNSQYEPNQFGYINSYPTGWCTLTSLCLYWGLSALLMISWLIMRHARQLATTKGAVKTGGGNSLTHGNGLGHFLQTKPHYIMAGMLPCINTVLQGSLSTQGPMGSYCGVRCEEVGIDEMYTSPGRCWLRIVSFYWLCLTFGVLVLSDALRLVLHIRSVHAMSAKSGVDQNKLTDIRKSKKNSASTKMRDRIIFFSIVVGLGMFVASVRRISSSITPVPETEGVNGITEYVGAVIAPFMIWTFSASLWFDALGCSKEVTEKNQQYARRNSYNNGSASSRSSSMRGSGLGNNGKKQTEDTNSTSKYIVKPPPGTVDTMRESDLAADSSASTVQLMTSPSQTPSKYSANSSEVA